MRSFRRGDRGQGLVEFALILPVFLLLAMGLIDVARAMFEQNTLAYAAREATRYAIVHGANGTTKTGPGTDTCTASTTYTSPAQECVNASLQGVVAKNTIGVSNVTVTATWLNGDNNRKSRVAVDLTAPTTPSLWLVKGILTQTLRASSTLVIEQ